MKPVIKSTIALYLLMTSLPSQAQWFGVNVRVRGNGDISTQTRTVLGHYDKIKVAGPFDVKLIKGKEGEIKVETDSNLQEHIIVKVKERDYMLIIKVEDVVAIKPSKRRIKITVPFTELNVIKLNGSGKITSSEIIKTKVLKTSLRGSGDLRLNVDAKEVVSKIAGSGNIMLKGHSKVLLINIRGSGDFYGDTLKTEDAEIKITGSGNVEVNVTGVLNAQIRGSGDIRYSGNPVLGRSKISGSGSIKSK
ncbi:MAG: DUF2807 domain-containing protein [Flavobacteriaceae bacterium]|nr:DUF2807 domain-containing protein [Flavobacteriaceae bacterium]